jgi:2-oxoisovalerate dehydrogenase E2 component (dihydrolipoyl transacylase)
MAEVLEFRLPDLGEGLTEAEIVCWLVSVGDVVAVDQPVVEVETAKARVEVPCPYGGVVTARFGAEGSELPVGAPLMTVAVGPPDAAGTDGSGDLASLPAGGGAGTGRTAADGPRDGAQNGRSAAPAAPARSNGTSGHVLVGYGTAAPAPRRRRVLPDARTGDRAATGGPTHDGPVPVVSPLVRRLARQHGLDLRRISGSGRDGLILRADVERAIRSEDGLRDSVPAQVPPSVRAPSARNAAAGGPAQDGSPQGPVRIPLKGVLGAAADKLSRSRQEIPDATCWVDADATELMAARSAMNAGDGPKISVLGLLARICTAALARHPELNATVDTRAREIVRLPAVHLGFAAQTDRGLVVPVVRDAHRRSAESLTAELARLAELARTGRLAPADMSGGTFTLNNYGVFGVDGSTPILNHPEAAMLGVGRIAAKPWVHDGELAVRQVVQLSLTFDHRVCDGGTAGGFLRYVADRVEQPALLLRTL